MFRATTAFAVVMLTCSVNCDRPRENPPRQQAPSPTQTGDFVFSWTVSHPHWGQELIALRPDGTLRHYYERPGQQGQSAERKLDAAELERVKQALVNAHPCALPRSSRAGKANESRPSLQVNIGTERCITTQWFDDWRQRDDARKSAEIIGALRASLAAQ